jgi:hypothetical protein
LRIVRVLEEDFFNLYDHSRFIFYLLDKNRDNLNIEIKNDKKNYISKESTARKLSSYIILQRTKKEYLIRITDVKFTARAQPSRFYKSL